MGAVSNAIGPLFDRTAWLRSLTPREHDLYQQGWKDAMEASSTETAKEINRQREQRLIHRIQSS